uniref:Lysosomal associated membrane protein 3 n=1 Tax=Fundulus heteroclitus TaxID=8078 RepID=A0A3Q2NTD7_FUNHE
TVLDSEAQFYRPVLQQRETVPTAGSYTLRDLAGRPCIKAVMGAEYIVIENKTNWYFNLDPSRVKLRGKCNKDEALLSLMLPDNSASLDFTFKKVKKEKENNHKNNPNGHKTYSGFLSNETLFRTANDKSFRCTSESLLQVSPELRIKLVPLQMQAFGVPNGQFGKEDECWADFNRRAVPIIIGSVAVGLMLSFVLSFLFIRDRQRPGYERL